MAPTRRRNALVIFGLMCAASMQIFGFVGQEVARQGREAAVKQEAVVPETTSVRRAPEVQEPSMNSLDDKKLVPNKDVDTSRQEVTVGSKRESKTQPVIQERKTAFVGPDRMPRAVLMPRRAEADTAAAPSPLQVPEANYFTMLAAKDCIEEGCPLEQAEEIAGKLARDEGRIRLQSMRKAAHLPITEEEKDLTWFHGLLSDIHTVRKQLQAMMNFPSPGFNTGFVHFLHFGDGPTAGFLKRNSAPVHQR